MRASIIESPFASSAYKPSTLPTKLRANCTVLSVANSASGSGVGTGSLPHWMTPTTGMQMTSRKCGRCGSFITRPRERRSRRFSSWARSSAFKW